MGEAPEKTTGMGAGHWLGLGCGAMLAVAAMVVILLFNLRRPRTDKPVVVSVATPLSAMPGEGLTAVEAQPDRDPFARPGTDPVDEPSSTGEPATDAGEPDGENTPPQPVMTAPEVDEPPVDEPPDIPEPSIRRPNRQRGETTDDGGDEGQAETVSSPPKPKLPTQAELKPHDPKEPPAWALPPKAAEGGLELVAVIAGQNGMAIFRKEGAYHRVRVGDKIDSLRVERIDTRGVFLQDGEHRFLIRMPDKIRPGGSRNGVASAPRTRPTTGTPNATPEPEPTPTPGPTTPEPTLAPLPAPEISPGNRGGTGGQRPSGQRPGGGWGRGDGQGGGTFGGRRPGGGQGGGQGDGQGGGTFGGAGRGRPSGDEGDGDQ